ncbi:MAG: 2-amino-4-hydroxy-6-hydroxymethyldihydropteridine diphosphokinase [Pelosinus sp.]|nr:2-amino-4-hydroxy-6-hydroxymethyldihydropteridine diphosphokinase [Pelosinus sp.]
MDKIYISDLEIYAYHGVFSEEKMLGQKFFISLELTVDLRSAGKTDALDKTVNYAELCDVVEKVFTSKKHDLIEKCAEELAEAILMKQPLVNEVKITIKKPWAPIGKHVNYVAVEITRCWHTAYISLGSNMGDKEQNIREALKLLTSAAIKVTKVSALYTTKPVGYTEQDDFLNGCAEIKTLFTPNELLAFMLEIEHKLKRERIIKWGPRTIDLDIVLFEKAVIAEEDLMIPHPRMHERMFVLEPLCEIAPYQLHPVLGKSIYELKGILAGTK